MFFLSNIAEAANSQEKNLLVPDGNENSFYLPDRQIR
jgi:hypothetical protein